MKLAASRTLRKTPLLLGVALGSFFLTPTDSKAGTAELKAIATALNGGTLPADPVKEIQDANSQDLAMTVMGLISGKSAAAAALYVGEALKRSDDSDFGTVMGGKLDMVRSSPMFSGIFSTPANTTKFIGSAAKNAATGVAPFADWVDEFARALTTTDQQAFDAAKAAIASKTAAAAIVGSRLINTTIDTDAERLQLAQQALLATNAAIASTSTFGQGLTVAALEISKYISATVTDPAKFAADLLNTNSTVGTKTTQSLLSKITLIAPGVVAGSPLNASAVLESLFTNNGAVGGEATYNTLTKKVEGSPIALATIKNASKLAASIGLVADTEQYSFLATSFGNRVASNVVKSTLVSGIAKALVASMVKKPLPANVNPLLGQARDNAANRADEAGEIAAYLLNAITGNNTPGDSTDGLAIFKLAAGATDKQIAATKKAATSMVLGIIKAVVGSYNLKKSLDFVPTRVAADVAGSVAQTLLSLKDAAGQPLNPEIYAAIRDTLLLDATAKAINKTVAPDVHSAIVAAFANTDGSLTKYEDGTVAAYQAGPYNDPLRGSITEPETDIRGS